MARLSSAQEALVRQLNVLEVHQREIHDTLEAGIPAPSPARPLHRLKACIIALYMVARSASFRLVEA